MIKSKICAKCNNERIISQFYKSKNKYNIDYYCKFCRYEIEKEGIKKFPEGQLLKRARRRAKENGILFNITKEDIVIPKVCPVFNKPFIFGKGLNDFSVSLDRIDSTKGYEKGNIVVISFRANTIKNDATLDELEAIVEFLKGLKNAKK